MLYLAKEFSGIRSAVSRLLHRLAIKLESDSSDTGVDHDEITNQGLRIFRNLEEIVRNESLPVYVTTRLEHDNCVYTNICLLKAKSRDIPGGRFIDFGQVIDVSDLGLGPEKMRDILALLNHKHPTHNDPTGDVQYYIEAVEGILCSLSLDQFPERRDNPLVQMLRQIRNDLYDSDSPGVILCYKRAVDEELREA